ncbi:fasciclin-like arabinogalactan protein 8 [Amaranthus tricolor]|uniref:fasciclin-like arabinogalactan protein 8 n=1 Tax=Amaranthus tricolor TaxID=29722 RepID=UPI00258C7396|nr:fasciclin-like arabinogalactan protein 8 [Amaranthus tricolor]
MASTSISTIPTIFSLLLLFTVSSCHNITEILESEPDLSQFNSYLTQTKLADEINARQTITVLALDNSAMDALTANRPLSVIKNLLSLHILLDYFDNKKLHSIPDGSSLTTSLYQTTGPKSGNVGAVNITDSKGGSVRFGSGTPGSNLTSSYSKSVKQIPYNISVIEISAPIIAPELLNPAASVDNITAVLEKAGCKTFAALLSQSGVLKLYQNQLDKGITIFAPNDEAFKAKGVPDLNKLSNAELVSLLQFHALSTYAPIGTLKTTKGKLPTLAPGAGKYDLSPSTAGDAVTLHTGVDSSRIADTVLDSTPVVIYSVDSLLLPAELFGLSPAPAPAPESDSPAPAPAPEAEAPAPEGDSPASSPPAPSTQAPANAPDADSPAGTPADLKSKKNGGERSGPVMMMFGSSVVLSVMSLVL